MMINQQYPPYQRQILPAQNDDDLSSSSSDDDDDEIDNGQSPGGEGSYTDNSSSSYQSQA